MRRTVLVLGIAAIVLAVLVVGEANLNRSEPRCRYEGNGGFPCGDRAHDYFMRMFKK
jgi:hypothetical protein